MNYLSGQSIPVQEIAIKRCITQYCYIPVACFSVLYDVKTVGSFEEAPLSVTSRPDIPDVLTISEPQLSPLLMNSCDLAHFLLSL